MKKRNNILKLSVLLISTVMILSIIDVAAEDIIELKKSSNDTSTISYSGNNIQGDWVESFDFYAAGSSLHGQGGWTGWDNNPAVTAYVSESQCHTYPNSVLIGSMQNVVHQFTGVSSKIWRFTVYLLIPSFLSGFCSLNLLNTYSHGGPYSWSTAIRINGNDGTIYSDPGGTVLSLDYGKWHLLEFIINFEENTQSIYYVHEHGWVLLDSKSWTEGYTGGGALNLAGVQLVGTYNSNIYFDTFTLRGIPELEIKSIKGGLGVKAVIANTGIGNADSVYWTMFVQGGMLNLINLTTDGDFSSLGPGEEQMIKCEQPVIFGFGKIAVGVFTAADNGIGYAQEYKQGFQLLFLTLI